jgi:hypothetical protein
MSRGQHSAENATISGAEAESERRPGLRAAGPVAARLAVPIIARGNGALARLKADWPAVVGSEVAVATWPAGLGRDGVLKMRVAAERALELQHRTHMLAERINLFFGRETVRRIVLVQGPLPLNSPPRPRPRAAISEPERRVLETRVAAISDPGLREALLRLGAALVAAKQPGR